MRLAFTVVLVWLLATPLLMVGTAGHAVHNGDEAIYAQMAREMREGGDWMTLRWQGEALFPRPPLVVWVLAAVGPAHLRLVLAAVCALELALVLALGWLWWGAAAGAAAAGVLLGADLFLGYARYFESEPFLCVMVLASLLCWERRRVVGWGLFLGLALMVKQVVGGLPLIALLGARRRGWGWGILAAAAVWLPWHIYAAVQHGRPFVDSYFLRNIVSRSSAPMLHVTGWSFYFRELWRSEGPFALAFAFAFAFAVLRWRRPSERVVALWSLLVVVVYSLARSRYDYYLLLAYPAFALAVGAAVANLPPRVRWPSAALLTVVALALHAPRNLHFSGEDEQRDLVAAVNQRLSPPARLYTYNTHAYAARFYSNLDVTTLLESADDLGAAAELRRAGMPSSVAPAPDLADALARMPRPFALLMPRARASLLSSSSSSSSSSSGGGLETLGESRHYLMLLGR